MYNTRNPTSKVPVKVNLDSGLLEGRNIVTTSKGWKCGFSVNVLWEWFSLLTQFSLYLAFVIMSLSFLCITDAPPIQAATLNHLRPTFGRTNARKIGECWECPWQAKKMWTDGPNIHSLTCCCIKNQKSKVRGIEVRKRKSCWCWPNRRKRL